MLEDIIKTEKVCGKTVSILLYSIAKEDRDYNEPHTKYYEIRVSNNDKNDTFYTDSEFYHKKSALQIFNQVCKEIREEEGKKVLDEYENQLKLKAEEFDIWLYPNELGIDRVINLFREEGKIQINEYTLPNNWKELVTQNFGKDGKLSIHDVMVEV